MLRTAFHRLEEGAVFALTKLEAALTPRRNLSERHVYNQLSRRAAEYDETRLVGKLSSRQEEQDQACSFRCTDAQDMDVSHWLCWVLQLGDMQRYAAILAKSGYKRRSGFKTVTEKQLLSIPVTNFAHRKKLLLLSEYATMSDAGTLL